MRISPYLPPADVNVRVRITMLGGGYWDILVSRRALEAAGGLTSGQVIMLERTTGDIQTQHVWIKPYYRRIINDEQHIFAVQVTPKKEASNG